MGQRTGEHVGVAIRHGCRKPQACLLCGPSATGSPHAVNNDVHLVGELVSPTKIRAIYKKACTELTRAFVTESTKAIRGTT